MAAAFGGLTLCAADPDDQKTGALAGRTVNSVTGQPLAKNTVSLQFDAGFRRKYQDSGMRVSVRAGENTEVEVKLVEVK